MARIDNTDRITSIRLLAHVQNHISKINRLLTEETNPQGKLSNSYVNSTRSLALAEGVELMKKWRWLWEGVDQLNQSPEAAYTDSEIDAIDEDIRTTDEDE